MAASQPCELVFHRFWGCHRQGVDLVGGLGPGLDGRTPGRLEHPDRLDGPVGGFGNCASSACERNQSCRLGIDGVGLAPASAHLAARAVHLHRCDAGGRINYILWPAAGRWCQTSCIFELAGPAGDQRIVGRLRGHLGVAGVRHHALNSARLVDRMRCVRSATSCGPRCIRGLRWQAGKESPCGGPVTGKSHPGRGRFGWKWPIATDRRRFPASWVISGTNRHEALMLKPLWLLSPTLVLSAVSRPCTSISAMLATPWRIPALSTASSTSCAHPGTAPQRPAVGPFAQDRWSII